MSFTLGLESYGGNGRYVMREGRRKLIFEHPRRARCVCILGTDDSRGKSVIERSLEVGKTATNGLLTL